MVTFSNPTKLVTIKGALDGSGVLTEWGLRSELESLARDHGFTVSDVTVEITDGPRTVTLTEAEYDALQERTTIANPA